jgi:hypothetical protein
MVGGSAYRLIDGGKDLGGVALLETLPLVQRGFVAFDVSELEPYPGFARLFAGR